MYCLILYSFGVLRHTHILHTEKQVVLKLSFPFCCFCSLYSLLVVGLAPFHCVIMLWGTFIKPAFVAQGILLISEGVARKRQGKFFVIEEFRNIFRSSENPKNNKPSKVWWWCNATLKFFWFCRFSKLQKGHFLSLMSSRCYSIIKAAAEELHWRCCCGRLLHFFNRISEQRRWTFWFDCLSFTTNRTNEL